MTLKDQLAESGCQKTKENIIPRGKFRLVENDLKVQQKSDNLIVKGWPVDFAKV